MRFTANSESAGRERVDGQVFGEMRQRDPNSELLSRKMLLIVIGVEADEAFFGMAHTSGFDGIDLYDCAIP